MSRVKTSLPESLAPAVTATSLCPELLDMTFDHVPRFPALEVLDSVHPARDLAGALCGFFWGDWKAGLATLETAIQKGL